MAEAAARGMLTWFFMKTNLWFKALLGNVAVSFVVASTAFAINESEPFNSTNPNLRAGQMFTVKVVPAGKELDIFVTGRRVKKIVFDDLELQTMIQSGEKRWFVPVKRKDGHFRIAKPVDMADGAASKLKVEVRHKAAVENFNFEVNTPPR
jgi:hypothetical protein